MTTRGTQPSSDITDRGFTGHRENRDIGLTYMNARYYVGEIGRFASADTLVPDPQNPQSFNRYAYGYNNPAIYTDPSGYCSQYAGVNGEIEALRNCLAAWNELGNYYGRTLGWDKNAFPSEYMNYLLEHGSLEEIIGVLDGFGVEFEASVTAEARDFFLGDFMTIYGSFSLVGGINATFIQDRFGNNYISFGLEGGLPGFGFGETSGFVFSELKPVRVAEADLESILQGFSTTFGGGYVIGGAITNPWGEENGGYGTAEVGVMSPSAALGVNYTIMTHDGGSYQSPKSITLWNSRFEYWYWYYYQR